MVDDEGGYAVCNKLQPSDTSVKMGGCGDGHRYRRLQSAALDGGDVCAGFEVEEGGLTFCCRILGRQLVLFR